MKKVLFRLFKVVSCMAFVLMVSNMNSACMWCLHQEAPPKAALKYKG